MSRITALQNIADTMLERFTRRIGAMTSYAFLIIVAITTYEVVARYVFQSPTIWVHEFTVMLAAVAFVIGGPLVHQHRLHITISFFHERMPVGLRRRVDVFSSLMVLVFLALLAWTTSQQAWQSILTRETSGTALNLPIPVLLKTLFAACVGLMMVQSLLHLAADIRTLRKGRS